MQRIFKVKLKTTIYHTVHVTAETEEQSLKYGVQKAKDTVEILMNGEIIPHSWDAIDMEELQ